MHAPSPPVGIAETLRPGLRRVIAPNPSPMTLWGTNTYLLGSDAGLCVIDPGPDDPAHLDALMAAIGPARVSHIVVTHSHLDHAPLARPLAARTGAPVLGFGPYHAGRSAVMQALVDSGWQGGGEGIDTAFVPDRMVADGQIIDGPGWALSVLHTPGHLGNHICLRWGDDLFSGDHLMGWSSSLVSPPDGDLTNFMASCRRLARLGLRQCYPGHGAPVTDPPERLSWLIAHRTAREAQIEAALLDAPEGATLASLTAVLYRDTPRHLHPAAACNVLAHLIDLRQKNRVSHDRPLHPEARFHPVRRPPE